MSLFSLTGRPGSGKSTSAARAKERLDGLWLPSITDRPRRAGELSCEEGGEYIWKTAKEIIAMHDRGELVSLVDPRKGEGQGKYFYGTPLDYLFKAVHDERRWWFAVLVLEVLQRFYEHCHGGRILSAYIKADSEEFLFENMVLHRGEHPDEAHRRLLKSATWDEDVQASPLPIIEISNGKKMAVHAVADRMVTIARHFERGGRVG